jgi:hypothetical protein
VGVIFHAADLRRYTLKKEAEKMIKLYTEKKVVRGEKFREIKKVDGVMEKPECPKQYFMETPFISFKRGEFIGINVCSDEQSWKLPAKDETWNKEVAERPLCVKETEFQYIVSVIKRAAERLSALRKEEKSLRQEWNGEETFIV